MAHSGPRFSPSRAAPALSRLQYIRRVPPRLLLVRLESSGDGGAPRGGCPCLRRTRWTPGRSALLAGTAQGAEHPRFHPPACVGPPGLAAPRVREGARVTSPLLQGEATLPRLFRFLCFVTSVNRGPKTVRGQFQTQTIHMGTFKNFVS